MNLILFFKYKHIFKNSVKTLKMFSLYFYQLNKSSSNLTNDSFYCIFRKWNFYGNGVCILLIPRALCPLQRSCDVLLNDWGKMENQKNIWVFLFAVVFNFITAPALPLSNNHRSYSCHWLARYGYENTRPLTHAHSDTCVDDIIMLRQCFNGKDNFVYAVRLRLLWQCFFMHSCDQQTCKVWPLCLKCRHLGENVWTDLYRCLREQHWQKLKWSQYQISEVMCRCQWQMYPCPLCRTVLDGVTMLFGDNIYKQHFIDN